MSHQTLDNLTPAQRKACEAYAHALTAATRSDPHTAGEMMMYTAIALERLGQFAKARLFKSIGDWYRGA